MNAETLASLSPEEQKEVWAFEKQFIKAVRNTKLGDGFAFARRFHIKQEAGYNVCSDGTSSLPGIRTKSKRSMEALFADAVGNYGR